jgi:hypothetical protein
MNPGLVFLLCIGSVGIGIFIGLFMSIFVRRKPMGE